MKKLPFQAKFIKKITIRDRGITALYIVYTVDMVYAVDMVYTVDTVDTVYTIQTVTCMPIYIARKGQNATGMGTFEQKVG